MKRRAFFQVAGLAATATTWPLTATAQPAKTTLLVAHGAWSAGWAWKKMHPLMTAAGYRLITPTYTGLGERIHLVSQSVDLETHIDDMLNVIKYEALRDVVLIGHSYGGMVATGVADRAADRIAKLIYLDAFVPRDGESLFDLVPLAAQQRMLDNKKSGDGWRAPPNPIPPDTSAEDRKWIESLRVPTPYKCFDSKLRLRNGDTKVSRTYIYCTRKTPDDTFRPFAERAKREGWDYRELDASHSPNITAPNELAKLLISLL